jgi:hypothetical protein
MIHNCSKEEQRRITGMAVGDFVMYTDVPDKMQVNWGGNDHPDKMRMKLGEIYEVVDVEIHDSHSHVKFSGIVGKFNPLSFVIIDPDDKSDVADMRDHAFQRAETAKIKFNITQVEVNALLANDRLKALTENGHIPTVEEVNEWAKKSLFGHDAINHWICTEARAKELGVWGDCPICSGRGVVYADEDIFKKHEEWELFDPPKGKGYQFWETTTEGSPQSPVFATLDELAAWCEKNASTFGDFRASKEEWIKMLGEDNVHHSEGRIMFI